MRKIARITEEIRQYIKAVRWKYAETMPEWPHEYTFKDSAPERLDTFYKFVRLIRKEGYREYFNRKKTTYYDVGEYKYWTMGAPVEGTILINRAKL